MTGSPKSSRPAFKAAAANPKTKVMTPKPSGTSGPKPPAAAKKTLDKAAFQRQLAASKQAGPAPAPGGMRAGVTNNAARIKAAASKANASGKARMTNTAQGKQLKSTLSTAASKVSARQSAKSSSTATSKPSAKSAFGTASRGGAAKSAFNSAARGGGKGGKSR